MVPCETQKLINRTVDINMSLRLPLFQGDLDTRKSQKKFGVRLCFPDCDLHRVDTVGHTIQQGGDVRVNVDVEPTTPQNSEVQSNKRIVLFTRCVCFRFALFFH